MSSEKGFPIYPDIERTLMDTAAIDDSKHEWMPDNTAAHKLYRCVECLRDLLELLDGSSQLKNATKIRRRSKLLFTPLHSLAGCILDLLSDCEGNPDTAKKIPDGGAKLISLMRARFLHNVPIGKDRLLSKLRDKTAAHVDKALSSGEIRQLVTTPELHEIGFWLDSCVTILCDLLKLPIYFWTCESEYPEVVRVLMCEPFLVSMRVQDGKMWEMVGCHIVEHPPRVDIRDLIFEVVDHSRWLFRPYDIQIRAFVEDEKDELWAKSLESLPKFSGMTDSSD